MAFPATAPVSPERVEQLAWEVNFGAGLVGGWFGKLLGVGPSLGNILRFVWGLLAAIGVSAVGFEFLRQGGAQATGGAIKNVADLVGAAAGAATNVVRQIEEGTKPGAGIGLEGIVVIGAVLYVVLRGR